MESWQINLSLIPSIAVILTSANRMALGLTDEINVRLSTNKEAYAHILPDKIAQLRRLSLAIFILYLSLSLLIVNALLIGIKVIPDNYSFVLIFIAIALFLFGVYLKIIFSWRAYQIRQEQFKNFLNQHDH
jgi:uncharacterized membrane protein (DUF485 family)